KTPAPPPSPAAAGGPIAAWVRFWFTPTDPVALHAVRVLTGLLLLLWLLPLAGHHAALFGPGGWFDNLAYFEAKELPGGPPQALRRVAALPARPPRARPPPLLRRGRPRGAVPAGHLAPADGGPVLGVRRLLPRHPRHGRRRRRAAVDPDVLPDGRLRPHR